MTFIRDERGATSIEYALIAGFIFLAVVAVFPTVAASVADAFDRIRPGLQ